MSYIEDKPKRGCCNPAISCGPAMSCDERCQCQWNDPQEWDRYSNFNRLWFNQVGEAESLWFNATSEEEPSEEEEEKLKIDWEETKRLRDEEVEGLSKEEHPISKMTAEYWDDLDDEKYEPKKEPDNSNNPSSNLRRNLSKPSPASKFVKKSYNDVKRGKVIESPINSPVDLDVFLKKSGIKVDKSSQVRLSSLINRYQDAINNGENLPPTEIPVPQGKKKKGKLKVGVTCCPPQIYIRFTF